MTNENLLKMHKHFSKLARGDFKRRDFDTETESSCTIEGQEQDGGMMNMGKLTAQRISLIKSTALVNKLEMEANFPELKPKVIPETPAQKKAREEAEKKKLEEANK